MNASWKQGRVRAHRVRVRVAARADPFPDLDLAVAVSALDVCSLSLRPFNRDSVADRNGPPRSQPSLIWRRFLLDSHHRRLVGGRLLTHELVGDRLTPCLLKHQSIYKQREVVYLDPANSVGSRIRRGYLTPPRAKFRESFTILFLIFSCAQIAIKSSNAGEL
jgi:hypothetical protein